MKTINLLFSMAIMVMFLSCSSEDFIDLNTEKSDAFDQEISVVKYQSTHSLEASFVDNLGDDQSAIQARTSTVFGPTDYWFAYENGGKCGPHAGQGGSSDAWQEMTREMNIREVNPNYTYFTEEECVSIEFGSLGCAVTYIYDNFPNPNDPIPGDNYHDWMLWSSISTSPNFELCLSPAEMNYYYWSTRALMLQLCPPGKALKSVQLEQTGYFCCNGQAHYLEGAFFTYGIPHTGFPSEES